MNIANLSFDALPPINLPFRFFLTAPFFALICVAIIFCGGEALWQSRWHPHTIALTHGFTLGVISMVMMGALLQMLPVVGGIGFPKVNLVAKTSHAAVSIGCLLLIASFYWPYALIMTTSLVLLCSGYGLFIVAIGWALMQKRGQGPTIDTIKIAVFCFALVITLGVLMLLQRLGIDFIGTDKIYTNIHALVGGFGWFGLLITAVSFQVIPMFHVAPSFHWLVTKLLPRFILAILLVALTSFFTSIPLMLVVSLLLLANAFFVGALVRVLSKRKRKIPDVTVNFWFFSAAIVALIMILFVLSRLAPFSGGANWPVLLTSLFLYGFVISVIEGLLLKILPFLSYTHLQQHCLKDFSAMQYLPNMHDFLNKRQANSLFMLHLLSTLLLIWVVFVPHYYWVFALGILLEFTWLLYLILRVSWLFNSVQKRIVQNAQ